MKIIDGSVDMKHVNFDPHPPSNAVGTTNVPVTEVLTAYTTSKDQSYEAASRKLLRLVESSADGCKGVSGGWVIEEGEGEKKCAFVSAIGWESKDHHMQFRDTQTFKDNIYLIREGSTELAVHHVCFVEK